MLQLIKDKGTIKLIADSYVLTWAADKPYIYLDTPMGIHLAELFPYSSIHPLHGRDDTTSVSAWEVHEQGDEIIISSTATSSIWKRKIYRFRCKPHRFIYETAVEGSGYLSEVNYFGGYYSGQVRWGSGFFWSGQRFQRGFNPEPNTEEVNEFMPGEGSMIDLMGVPLPGKGHWFFTPPPFCYAFLGAPFKQDLGKQQGSIHGNAYQDPEKLKPVWLGLGVEAYPGENRFMEYGYHGRNGGFYLSLGFEGHTMVSGYYCLPAIGFDFANDAYTVLAGHVSALQEKEAVSWPEPRYKPAWWSEPIFCGWGAQCYQAALQKAKAPDFARQDLYEQFLKKLEENGIIPGTIVLDDKWQLSYGENQVDEQKWPDLVDFIHRQHTEGRKVLLWLKAWDPEGIQVEECITNAQRLPLAIDPTNPNYESRLRKSIRQMLSPAGYNADGFKIDFTARIPSGPGICTYGDLWGLELMRHYLQIIYDEAKLTKRDALIMTHTPHPYLADVVDMIRLNDINQDKDVIQAMKLRATIARISCPEAIIDTDNWPVKDLATWRKYLRLQPKLGVPSLYFVSHIDSTKEPLTPQDYRLIRMAWAKYRAKGMPVAKKAHRFSLKPRRNFWHSDFATRFHLAITGRK